MLSLSLLILQLFSGNLQGFSKTRYRLLGNETTTTKQDHHHVFTPDNTAAILSLPFVLSVSINGYLKKKDIHSWMRSCKSNLDSCQHYIRNLLSIKFDYLLSHNDSKIQIEHLLNIPLVDSIVANPLFMPVYIGTASRSSSKYIGIDRMSGNGFISFWMKRIDIEHHPWRIITFVFNATQIDPIYLSDSSDHPSILTPLSLRPSHSMANQIKVINEILFTGKIDGVAGQCALWCLHDQWESFMFWPRIRAKHQSALRYLLSIIGCKRQTEMISVIVFATLFWIVVLLVVIQVQKS